MAETHHHREAERLRQSLADLFDQLEPNSRPEAEQELRSAGIDPDGVGSRCERLAAAALGEGRRAERRPAPHWRRAQVGGALPVRRGRLLWIAGAALVAGMAVALWPSSRLRPPGGYPPRTAARPAPALPGAPRLPGSDVVSGRPAGPQARAAQEPAREPAPSTPASVAASGEAPPGAATREEPATAVEAGGIATDTVVTANNLASYEHMLSPGVAWAVRNGLEISVSAARPIRLPDAYRDATDRHAAGVRLSADRLGLEGYVAGLPFPAIDPDDPDAALKIMWNYEYRPFATDDVQARDVTFETGTLGRDGDGMAIDRRIVVDRFERLFSNGRLFTEPRPEMPGSENVRYRERLYTVREPVDLRGVGVITVRYQNGGRADDTWLYLPTLRRVRRLSPVQRSDALFGQEADLDSLLGFSGPVPSMSWRFLGERVVLACVHAQRDPVAWGAGSGDFAFADVWEPRSVYVVEGRAKAPQYAYGKRILFIDRETWSALSSEMYDRTDALWKVWLNMFGARRAGEGTPGDAGLVPRAAVMIDTQLGRATRIHASAWSFNSGAVSEDSMTIRAMIQASQ